MCLLVFDFGFGEGGLIVDAPVDRLEALVDETLFEELEKVVGDARLVLRRHGEIGFVPAAEDAHALELLALQVDIFLGVLAAGSCGPASGSISSFLRPRCSSTLISMGRPWQSQPGT